MTLSMSVVHCRGIHTDSLGHYLSGLGLLAAVAKKWPSIRASWRSGHLVLVGRELTLDLAREFLLQTWQPTTYERWWDNAFNKDRDSYKKQCPTIALRKARGEVSADQLLALDATVVAAERPVSNPIFGNLAGQLGAQRDFSRVHESCMQFLLTGRGGEPNLHRVSKKLAIYLRHFKKQATQARKDNLSAWLDETLLGIPADECPPLGSTGTWFLYANKTFNSGQSWFREGQLSPWSFLLALEGAALFLSGNVNRRLGARARPYAVFPFISDPSRPAVEGEIGLSKGEFWAPLWERPATIAEVRALFQRGLAQLGGRAAQAPHEFAVAARAAGVDAGVTEFVRYELRQTTSTQVYEAVPRQRIQVRLEHTETDARSQSLGDGDLMLQLIESGWLDRLEPRYSKQRDRFVGLRGPVEAAIIETAENHDDPDRWQYLLRLLATTQFRIDHNRSSHKRCTPLPLLHPAWFMRAWPGQVPDEVRIAQSVASIGAGTDAPILVNVFGVQKEKHGQVLFPKSRPNRAVWSSGDPVRLFIEVIHRRLTDVNPGDAIPLQAVCPCATALVNRFIAGAMDFEMIAAWIPPLALIDWPNAAISMSQEPNARSVQDGNALLHALFRPFFHPGQIWVQGEPLFPTDRLPRAGLAKHLLNQLRYGQINGAVQMAWNAYRAIGRTTVRPHADIHTDANRIAAALLIPTTGREIASGIQRWLEPQRTSLN